MSLKSKTFQFVPASGIDDRFKGKIGFAEKVVNGRVDPSGGGWRFDRGLESWWKFPTTFTTSLTADQLSTYLGSKVDSIYVWEKAGSGQVYHFVEVGGTLGYFWGNKSTGDYLSDFIEIASNRHIPKVTDAGTQYIPYGKNLLIINGYDKPIWFSGNKDYRDFGITSISAAPKAINPQPDYLTGTDLRSGVGAPAFIANDIEGLGYTGDVNTNFYEYRMTYILSSGAESTLSSVAIVQWILEATPANVYKWGVVLDFPQGPKGTVARRLYRSKNVRVVGATGANDANFYFVREVEDNACQFLIDIIPDSRLIIPAPSIIDSKKISSNFKYGATWNNRIWLGGGDNSPTTIVYSEAGLPEQFAATSYFELGNTVGGHITAIVPYYNNLLVFRRNAIDVIRQGSNGLYTHATVSSNIGTIATNSCKLVPGLGILFLNEEAIWAITGGLDGGSQISMNRISETITKELDVLNKAALPRAFAAYSEKEREYWVHYAERGQRFARRGIVFHADIGQFSLRHDSNKSSNLMAFTCMTTDTQGNFLLGNPQIWTGAPGTLNSTSERIGPILVWSGNNNFGQSATVSLVGEQQIQWAVSDQATKPRPIWESNWIDFGDNSVKHRVYSVEVEVLSYGDQLLQLLYSTDYDYSFTSASIQKPTRSEVLYTTNEDAVFNEDSTITKSPFTINSSVASDPRIVRLRYDVNTKLINHFKFKLQTSQQSPGPTNTPFHILSFHINFDTVQQQSLNQAINIQKGQSR
jgi:hypothetical protein